jgi:uncharacterized iron-regulated protein
MPTVATAPAAAPAEEKPPHGAKGATEPVALPHHVLDAEGARLDDAKVAERLRKARLIFVGEQHSNPHHHAAQLEVLTSAWHADPSVGIGLEMLPYTMQPALDAYVSGAIDEKAFLEQVHWEKTWGFPWGFYRPLLAFCREHHLKAYALNAPRDLSHKVAMKGLESLSADEKKQLPEMKPGPAQHRELVREAFGAHPHDRFSETQFERFYTAQLVWDETMAERAVAALAQPGAPAHLVVIAGEGHTRKDAIPARAARRGAQPTLRVLPVLDEEIADAQREGAGDLYWVLETK